MKALRISEPGNVEDLVVDDTAVPDPPTGDVLVQVRAAGFTPHELLWPSTYVDRAGRTRTPSIVAHEVSGVVVDIGFGTTGFEVGDEVFGLTDSYRDGAAAEFVSVEARNLAAKPATVSHPQAASLAQAALTAWQALFDHSDITGESVVAITGPAGAVGGYAVQLAKHAGATVIAAGRADAEEAALANGADYFVDIDHHNLDAVARPTVVFDTIGGEVLESSVGVVAPGGSVISIVVPPPAHDHVHTKLFVVEANRQQLAQIADLVASGQLTTGVSASYELTNGRQAFRDKAAGLPGKVVLLP